MRLIPASIESTTLRFAQPSCGPKEREYTTAPKPSVLSNVPLAEEPLATAIVLPLGSPAVAVKEGQLAINGNKFAQAA